MIEVLMIIPLFLSAGNGLIAAAYIVGFIGVMCFVNGILSKEKGYLLMVGIVLIIIAFFLIVAGSEAANHANNH